jgi:hypothetical protein
MFIYVILFGAAFFVQYLTGIMFPVNIVFGVFLGLEIAFLATGSKRTSRNRNSSFS